MNNNKINFFDDIERLRGFACLLVYIQHFALICPLKFIYNILPAYLLRGEGGMRIFFAISGFVVTLSLVKKLESISGEQFIDRLNSARSMLYSFYKNRFFRIFPVVFIMLLIMFTFMYLTENDTNFMWSLLRCPIDVFFGVHNYSVGAFAEVEKIHFGGTGSLWTLAVEGQFYLLWPIVLLLCKDNNIRTIVSLGMGCLFLLVVQPMASYLGGISYYSTYNNLAELFLGSFFAFIYKEDMGKNANRIVGLIASTIMALAIWYYPSSIDRNVFFCKMVLSIISVSLVVLCVFVRGSFNVPGLGRIFQYLGSRSFSFYVIHLFIANVTVWYVNSIHFPKESFSTYDFYKYEFIIGTVASLVLAEILYRFVEKPLRNFGRK
ncbi:MAG: acyltransferase [Holosporaceae bacterium]|jgi:peptidoglycan/LPS O-acetylase OafA/YrhL|nr:acyltransferase [Holosporaceae bacterium]